MGTRKKLLAIAAAAGTIGLPLVGALPASASSGSAAYQATLKPVVLNGQNNASAMLTLTLHGDVARIHETASGLAATFNGQPYPHVQHIHGGAKGTCPTASADKNGDGVISTSDGAASYGGILTTLSVKGGTAPSDGTNVKIAPSGSSFTYDRTITLDSATLKSIHAGNAVIVIHGLDPATAPKKASTEKSELPGTTSFPLAATAPALCGKLVSSEMSVVPNGGAATGGGSTAGIEDKGLLATGAALLAAASAGGIAAARRRRFGS